MIERLKQYLEETEKRIYEKQDKIPEVFNDIDDGYDYYYYDGILDTIKEIKKIIGA
jgi:hypothetical protein